MDITDTRILSLSGYALLLGAVLGACWGIFSCVRILLTPDRTVTIRGRATRELIIFTTDILYSLFAAVCVVFLFFGANGGRIRLLGIAGCAAGFSLYHYTIGKRLIGLFSRVVSSVRRVIRFIFRHTIGVVIDCLVVLLRRPVAALRKRRERRVQRKKMRKREKRHAQFTV